VTRDRAKGSTARPTGVVLTLLLLACARPAPSTSEISVELDAFSGRPNPTWTLSSAEAEEALRRLRGLPSADAPVPDMGLGYRGFILTGDDQQLGVGVRVVSGLVVRGEGVEPKVYRDVNGLESYLAELAGGRGFGGVLER
jgi:hypothetical protein